MYTVALLLLSFLIRQFPPMKLPDHKMVITLPSAEIAMTDLRGCRGAIIFLHQMTLKWVPLGNKIEGRPLHESITVLLSVKRYRCLETAHSPVAMLLIGQRWTSA